ncbi:DUF327 family protein [Xylanibacillus composti]|uniref:DUF327 family protein n=1 Tax=Xylanibacillus composti TaxID=1572762 RepID=A0A8J4H0M7_9BACL|nr:YaaR family protein [Xylanibacillus composti]MDT9725170.1 DUF327 family protein [Xylanibacillus composti]GIQ67257.1 hypothetical protein XYCOK13_00810 [Xylanibacillus composti]
MKINPGWRSTINELKRTEQALSQTSSPRGFSDMMQQQQERATEEQLKRRIEEIRQQGERLAKSMTVRELRAYKTMIRAFLEETARRGVHLKETRGWDRRGRGKRYRILEDIDRHLLELADDMLEREEGQVDLLRRIGEIQGLLINVFF